MLDVENLSNKFTEIVESEEWRQLQEKYNMSKGFANSKKYKKDSRDFFLEKQKTLYSLNTTTRMPPRK